LIGNISYKEFMDQVEKRLTTFSPDTLQMILLDWAKNTHPSKRDEFLSKLTPALTTKEESEPDKELLEEINELAQRVDNGDYCEGWGWDDAIQEERDWGDESWADETDEFFIRAHDAMTFGHYTLAKDAYARLFDILDMGEEAGHLPGSPDPQDLLDTDLNEARSCYLRSVYISTLSHKRPTELLRLMQRFRHHPGDELNLRSVVNAELKPLPEFPQFLLEWIALLKESNELSASYLLREAVILSGGTPAIAKLAHDEGNRFPRAYVDWIKALEKDGDFPSMLKAAKDGLAAVPRNYAVRAEIAEGMVRAGERLKNIENQLAGWHEAVYSDPTLTNLLSLLSIAEQTGRYREEIEEVITRAALLLEKGGKSQSRPSIGNRELQESSASVSLLNQAFLLAGRYDDAFNLCEKEGASGWSYRQNLQGLAIPFFLKLISKGKALNPAPNLEQLWQEALSNLSEYGSDKHNLAERFERAIEKIGRTIHLSAEEENKYLRWCIEEIGHRVDAIVGDKDRHSYNKAATLLVALAEVLANRDQKSKGIDTIEKYRQKYCHYSAFRKELIAAAARSSIRL
jgi:hypothetical protein